MIAILKWPAVTERVHHGSALRTVPEHRVVLDVHGNRVYRPSVRVLLRSETGPELDLPSGRLVVADPIYMTDSRIDPLARTLAPGRYSTQFLIAKDVESEEETLALAVVWIKAETPAAFAPAPTEEQVHDELAPGEMFGIGVDSGSLCFADARAGESLTRPDGEATDLTAAAEAAIQQKLFGAFSCPGVGQGVVWSSGFGDGVYSAARGLDHAGEPVCLIVDCNAVQSDILQRAYAPKQPWWRSW